MILLNSLLMIKNIFILVPSLSPTGPVKGAIALANSLACKRKVYLAILKQGNNAHVRIDPKVEIIYLYEFGTWFHRLKSYKTFLEDIGSKANVVSISSCFSADLLNLFCRNKAMICSSIRGNLPLNYSLDYGWKGNVLAAAHLSLVRGFHHVVVMSHAMSAQVSRYLGRTPEIIGNFVDEEALEKYRSDSSNHGQFRLVFVGTLSTRKRPHLIIDAINIIKQQGYDIQVDFIGGGPLIENIKRMVNQHQLEDMVTIHGHLEDFHNIVARADVFVLPSLSEGISRACMEALFLGVPSVLRDVDGNKELIEVGVNGFLFKDDAGLAEIILSAIDLSRNKIDKSLSLLPKQFQQLYASSAYLHLVENDNG